MFSNAYNRKIADEVYQLNKKFIQHQKRVGRAMTGGADYMVDDNMVGSGWFDDMTSGISKGINTVLGPVGQVASILTPFMGLGKVGRPRKGKGMTGGAMVGSAMTGGKRKVGRPRKGKGLTGGAELLNQVQKMDGGKRKAGRPRKVKGGMEGEGIFSSLLDKIGLGEGEMDDMEGGKRRKKAVYRRKLGKGEMEGEGIFSGLLSKIGLGEGEDMEGGKRKAGRPRKGKGMTGGAMTGGMAGRAVVGSGRKKTSPWIAHVKAYAKKHNMKYNEALKDPKCRASYK
jgi:hypothetical protein